MKKIINIPITVCVMFLVANCASSGSSRKNSQAPKATSHYKTPLIYTNFDLSEDALAKASKLKYQVEAHCRGEQCIPKEARLSFYIESGRNTVFLSDQDLSLNIEKERYHWNGRFQRTDIRDAPPAIGNIISVTLKPDTLQKVANTKKVTGVLAGHAFDWSYKNRQPIRVLIHKMKSAKSVEE